MVLPDADSCPEPASTSSGKQAAQLDYQTVESLRPTGRETAALESSSRDSRGAGLMPGRNRLKVGADPERSCRPPSRRRQK